MIVQENPKRALFNEHTGRYTCVVTVGHGTAKANLHDILLISS